jgi:hypothetical protein
VGPALSQLPPDVVAAAAVQFNVPPPVLVMFTVWLAGFDPPAVAVNVSEVGLKPIVGRAAMFNVTAIVCGVLEAPGAVMVIVPLYVPAANAVLLTVAVRVLGAVPDPGETLSQLPPEVVAAAAVQFNVPLPPLLMDTVWLGGLVPALALKVSEVGDSTISGAGETFSVTATNCGVFVAPAALMVMVPL